jgi:RNA polymerase sigma factor (sigma-70 family)
MSSEGSITAWLGELKAGKESAAQKLWERYVARLVGLARSRLGRAPQAAGDEEDVVQAAFKSFFAGVQNGRFPQLNDRDDLWRLLVVLTERRAIDHIRRECRRAPAGPLPAAFSAGEDDSGRGPAHGPLGRIPAREPTPEFAAQVAEEYVRLLQGLEEDRFRRVAALKMEGYTNEEIAAQLDCSLRTVERRLAMIRQRWEEQGLALEGDNEHGSVP